MIQQSYYGNKPHGAYDYVSPTFSMTVLDGTFDTLGTIKSKLEIKFLMVDGCALLAHDKGVVINESVLDYRRLP